MSDVPWFGARRMARELQDALADLTAEREQLAAQCRQLQAQLARLGALPVLELEAHKAAIEREIVAQQQAADLERATLVKQVQGLKAQIDTLRQTIVVTEETALLQEAGVYKYRHPLSDAVAYEKALDDLWTKVKEMTKKDGGAVEATTNWSVNGSATEGKAMVRDFSKLMLRAFNAEADNLVRTLKPYKLEAALERLEKVADTIARLGKTMQIRISGAYLKLREQELTLTADFLQKQAEEKEAERQERERLREERKVQAEIERERARLEKERQHYQNALNALVQKGDDAGVARMQQQLGDVDRALADVDYRAANIRAGYVYVISNIGSFGEQMVKVGMTRRLDPVDRIRELSDASVPFNFDIHALFFSKDAVGIEQAMHQRLAPLRVNTVNRRREFFRASPLEIKAHLAELAGELLQFTDVPEALEYRQCLASATPTTDAGQGLNAAAGHA